MARSRPGKLQHPGVSLHEKRRPGGTFFEARWIHPDTEEPMRLWLAKEGIRKPRPAREWCVAKSREIAARTAELQDGAERLARVSISKAIRRRLAFLATRKGKNRTSPASVLNVKGQLEEWGTWMRANGVTDVIDIRPAHLRNWRRHLSETNARTPTKGSKSARTASDRARSPQTLNKHLQSVRGLLRRCIVDDETRLSEAKVNAHLEPFEVGETVVRWLRPSDVRLLLIAALEHDAARFKSTRAEHSADYKAKGKTPKHKPIAPFVALLLLTGMRAGELRELRWDRVLIDPADANAHPGGSIELRAEDTKTRRRRSVTLAESPVARDILRALMATRGDATRVFGMSPTVLARAVARLRDKYDAPDFGPKMLRATAATIGCCAPGVYASAALVRSCKRLGHGHTVALKHYCDVLVIPPGRKTFEDAYGCRPVFEAIATSVLIGAQQQLGALRKAGELGDVRGMEKAPRSRTAKTA